MTRAALLLALLLAGCDQPYRLSPDEVQERLRTCAAGGWDAEPVNSIYGALVGVRCVERRKPE